jgi:hypothetical protein
MDKIISSDYNNIGELVRKAEDDFITGEVQFSKYVSSSLFEDINKIEAYLNSKHTSGEVDSQGREKPFFNIVLAARNIWFRATDIDRKNIRIKATKAKDLVASFLASVHLQDYMRRDNFGQFLNDWGLYLASYNSAVCKFVEKEDKLHAMVLPWNRLIVDSIDFYSNPVIEILEFTPAQLKQKEEYNQEIVDSLIETLTARETIDKRKKDIKNNYIKLYEVHGNLPLSYLTGKKEDKNDYVRQMHIITFVEGKQKGGFDDFTLFSGREKKTPYMLTWLIPSVDGSISLMGSVKSLFEAQWMVNYSVKAIKDQLDLTSKLIFQTSDPSFTNQNALSAIENGQILIYKENMPLTQVANNSHDITSLQAFGQQWQVLAQELSSTPDIMQGNNMPSGTAFRQAAIVQQESHSNFKIMTQNKGLAIEQMMREYIIPYLKKKMDTSEEISATLESYDITKIDSIYIPNESVRRFNRKAIEAVINRAQLPDINQEMQGVKQELGYLGNQRFFKPSEISDKTWKDIFKDLEWDVECEITDENIDKEPVLTTLSSILQTLASNPAMLQNPDARLVWNKILEETGRISPIELSTSAQQPVPQMGGQMAETGNNQNNNIAIK